MKKALPILLLAVALIFSFSANGLASTAVSISSFAAAATPDDGGGDDDSCAASAVLGSDNPQLGSLRLLRDEVLSKSPAGRQIIKLYYAASNQMTAAINSNPALKKSARQALESILPAIEVIIGK